MRWLLLSLLLVYNTLAIPPAVKYGKPHAAQANKQDRCMAWVLWDEARGEPLRGARAVMDAVLARMHKRELDACHIVAEKHQFTGYRPGVIYSVGKKEMELYNSVLGMKPVVPNCGYFHSKYVHPEWANQMTQCKIVGSQIFYKEKQE